VLPIVIGVLALAVTALVGLWLASWMKGPDPNPSQPSLTPTELASRSARQLVAQRIGLPSTARFASQEERVRQVDGRHWEVSSHVDVPARVGGILLRQKWVADLERSGNGWTLTRLVVDGEIVEPPQDLSLASPGTSRPAWLSTLPTRDDPEPEPRHEGATTRTAVEQVLADIRQSAQLRPTLAVWLIDRSASADAQRQEVFRLLDPLYRDLSGQAGSGGKMKVAVAGFASDVQFLLEPSADAALLRRTLEAIEEEPSGQERTFEAILQVVRKYQPLRAEQGGYLMLVVVSDETGDDVQRADEAIALVRQHAIPVHVIGVPAPFGRLVGDYQRLSEGPPTTDRNAPSQVRQGPESYFIERIDLAFPSAGFTSESDLLDSGFGPFALSRLCLEAGGTYFACRDFGLTAGSRRIRSTWGGRTRAGYEFDPRIMRRYAPDYVSEAEYRQILAGNKACMALHEASKLPHMEVLVSPTTDFPKRDEASFKRALDAAQRDAARFEPKLLRLYEILKSGEADRTRLTSPRWQAGYDLAMGRALAARVRTEGYNAMLAKIKAGGNFTQPGSTAWVLQESDSIGAGSTYEKMLEQARMYLTRVAKDHSGTPWAVLAERELETKLGWEWIER
jgi:hypothetical protein